MHEANQYHDPRIPMGQQAQDRAYASAQNAINEPDRAVAASMTELASMCGDLESEVRSLARRVAPLIPGGSPFDALDKQAEMPTTKGTGQIAPARSHLADQLQSRIYQLRQLASTISGMVERIEI